MMLLFLLAAWDWAFGIVNQHLTYAVVTLGLAVVGAGKYFGLDAVFGPQAPSLVPLVVHVGRCHTAAVPGPRRELRSFQVL